MLSLSSVQVQEMVVASADDKHYRITWQGIAHNLLNSFCELLILWTLSVLVWLPGHAPLLFKATMIRMKQFSVLTRDT